MGVLRSSHISGQPIARLVRPANEIPLQQPFFDDAERNAAANMISTPSSVGSGKACAIVERELAHALCVKHALLTSSGTHALETAMMALKLGPGDEVILPSFTFSSCANAVVLRGARPVFADVQPRLMTIDPDDVVRKLTSRTRAIMPVHYGGMTCDMDRLLAISHDSGVPLIEDAAQAIFARHRDRYLGTIGLAGCLSFHHTKNVSCGEGGALLTDDDAFAANAQIIREKGTNRAAFLKGQTDKYTWVGPGSSYVVSDINATILEQQLAKREQITAIRTRHWLYYHRRLEALENNGLVELPSVPDHATPNYHLFWAFTVDGSARDRVLTKLRAAGIGAAFHFVPLHTSPYGQSIGAAENPLPVTEHYAARLIRLPLYAALTDEDTARVADAFSDALSES